jgi:hypothetical protein
MRRTLHPHAEGEPAVDPDFDTVEDLRLALSEFRDTYNATWLIQRLGYRTPEQARHDQLSTAALAA